MFPSWLLVTETPRLGSPLVRVIEDDSSSATSTSATLPSLTGSEALSASGWAVPVAVGAAEALAATLAAPAVSGVTAVPAVGAAWEVVVAGAASGDAVTYRFSSSSTES